MSAVDENTSPQSVGDLISAVEWPHKAIVSGVLAQSERGALPRSLIGLDKTQIEKHRVFRIERIFVIILHMSKPRPDQRR